MGDYGYTKVELVYRIILLDSTESGQRNIPIENISPQVYVCIQLGYMHREHRYCVNPSFITDLSGIYCNIVNKRKVY